jgi:SAM-dependent methyltransferase
MLPQATKTPGELRYRLRCIDKLGYRFRGEERLLDSGCGDGGVARLLRERVAEVVAIDVEPSESWANDDGLFPRKRFHALVRSAFPDARFGRFEAHYVPQAERMLGVQNAVEELLERVPLASRLVSYNYAVATTA